MATSRNPKPLTVHCPLCGLELPASLKTCPQDGVPLTVAVPSDPMVGTVIGGRYEVLGVVGRGGMSVVYKARNRAVGSIVAIKTLKQDLVTDEELFARFCQEAKAVQMLIHPNIVTVHEFGVTLNGLPFIAMDFLDGTTLADIIDHTGRIPVKRMLKVFIQVCDALAHAHTHKIIHRDIKPGNIMLIETANDKDVVKLFDFGFAKLLPQRGVTTQALTQQGDVLGTPLYMSPEQSRGKELDSRSDIYSLGCVMYEALTGKAPIVGDNVLDTMHKQINEMPQTLDIARPDLYIPEALTMILFRTLEKDRNDRYQSMLDLKRDLEVINDAIIGKTHVSGAALPGLAKLKRLPKRNRIALPVNHTLLVTAACVLVAATAIGALALFKPGDPSKGSNNASKGVTNARDWARYRQEGIAALQQRRYAEAEELFNQALRETHNLDDPNAGAATIYADLADVYLSQDKLSDAEKAANKSLQLRQRMRQTSDRTAGDIYFTLGKINVARDNFKVAEVMFEKALGIQQRELGAYHQDVGATFNELAKAAEAQKAYARAQAYYKQALAVRQAALGPKKLPVAETLSDYARLLKKMGKTAEANKAQERAQAIRTANRS